MTALSVSVVVPTHRAVGSVAAALDALRDQTLPPDRFEAVVVLNGDDAGRTAELARRDDPFRLVVVRSPRRGRAAACNLGAASARGDVLLFLDDDMRLERDGLRAHLARHEGTAETAVVGAAPVQLAAGASFAARYVARRFDRHLAKLARPDHRMDVRDVYTGAFSIRRTTFTGIGGFDERFVEYGNEDGELAGRLLAAGVDLVFAPEAVARQRYDKTFAQLAADNVAKGRTAVRFGQLHPDRAAESAVTRAARASRRRRLARAVGSRLVGRRGLLAAAGHVAGLLERRSEDLADRFAALVLESCFSAGVREASRSTVVAPRTVVHYTDSSTAGGGERIALTLAAGLDHRRWRPVLVVHAGPGLGSLVGEARRRGIRVVELPPRTSGPRDLVALTRAFRRLGPSVVHVHRSWARSGTVGVLAARLAGRGPVVATEHLFLPTTPRRVLAVRRVLDRLVAAHVAVSNALGSVLSERFGLGPGRVRVIRNGIGPVPLPAPATVAALRRDWLGTSSARAVVAVPARLDRQKGHATLLAALPRLPGVLAVFAGDGPERDRLELLAVEHGVADRVRFLGRREDVAAVLAAADVVVLPSLAEGMPLALLEACTLGRPVVASDVGGVPEVVREGVTGRLVPAADAVALAQVVDAVLADPAGAARMAAAARRAMTLFGAEGMVRETERLYDDVLGASVPPTSSTGSGRPASDLRALDWRFLVGRHRFSRIAQFPPAADPGPFGPLADVASEVVDGGTAGSGSADLAVADDPDGPTLLRLADVLVPGGRAVVRTSAPLGRAVARCRRAGLADPRVFAPWPSSAHPRAWLPVDDVEACLRVLGDGSERGLRRRLGRIRRRLWLGRTRAGLGGALFLVAGRHDGAEPPSVTSLVREMWPAATGCPAPERLTSTALTGGREGVSKVGVVVTAAGTRGPGLIVKWPRTAEGGRGLAHEAEMLHLVGRAPGPIGRLVPAVVARHPTDVGPALVETLLAGEPLARRLDRRTHAAIALGAADWLADLAERVPGSGVGAASASMDRLAGLVGDGVDPALVAAGRALARGLPQLRPVVEHRDMAPWNVLIDPDGCLRVVDWESSVRDGLPLLDLWYFLTWAALAVERRPESELADAYPRLVDPRSPTGRVSAIAVDRYATRLGLDRTTLGALRALTWVAHVPAELARLRRTAPGSPDADLARRSTFVRLWAQEVRAAWPDAAG